MAASSAASPAEHVIRATDRMDARSNSLRRSCFMSLCRDWRLRCQHSNGWLLYVSIANEGGMIADFQAGYAILPHLQHVIDQDSRGTPGRYIAQLSTPDLSTHLQQHSHAGLRTPRHIRSGGESPTT